ncbi:MAG: TolC family protein [Deltaproteobacteria bacterium]|nr:TolC family protein [Deltaproteobacteria bacterium]
MNKKIVFLLLLFLISGKCLWADETPQKGEVLTLKRCVDLALKNHPAIIAASGIIRQTESRIGQARAGYYPQLAFQSGYSRIGPTPSSTFRSDPYNYYTNTLNLNQMLFDFGKTSTLVDIRQLSKQSADADFQDASTQIVLAAKDAYYSFLKARMSESVAAETVDQFRQHYDIAKTFFETGKSSKIDVTSAEVNLSNARIQLITAQNALRIARANLNKAMGLTSAPEYDVREEFHLEQTVMSFEEALDKAYKNRPDLLSTSLKKDALQKTIDFSRKDYLPVLSGSAGYGYTGDDTSMDKSWNIGVALTFPLFTGLSTKYAVDEARANLEIAAANEQALKQAVYLEVQSAWLSRREALERISAGTIVVRQAEETVELARGRYATGVGSSIEITDALIKLNNAKITYISALSDFSVAQARLEKAIGEK